MFILSNTITLHDLSIELVFPSISQLYSPSTGLVLSFPSALSIYLIYDGPVPHDSFTSPILSGLFHAGVNFSLSFKLVYPRLPITYSVL